MPLERRVLLWMCVLVAVNQLGFGAMIPSLPLYAQSFGVAASAVGMAVAVYGLARFFVAVPSGRLSDWLGRRPTLAIGGLVSAIGNLWCAVATSYPEFIVARFVAGAGAGLIVTTGQVVLADITTPATRGRTLSIYQGTFIFAVGIGPFPGGLLAQHFGLAAPFWAYGIAAGLATLVAWFMVPETRDLHRTAAGTSGKPSSRLGFVDQVRLFTGHIGFLLVSLIVLIGAVVRTGGMFTIIPVLAHDRLGSTTGEIGFALMLGSVAGLVSTYPSGWLTDRFGRKAVIVPATLMTGTSMLLFGYAPSYAWFMVASLAWGVAISASGTAPAAYAADTAPPGMNAAAMSVFRMIADAGYVLGPLVLGLIVDLYGATAALVLAAALIVMVGLAFAIGAPETYRGRKG
ncbi:MAG: MFS transporter [Hyphomicrobiaceae bacterium]|nr:MFS transporter [Hyphomicrobiaceae bacterium]